MTGSRGSLARPLLFLALFVLVQPVALADDFGMIVDKIQKHYRAKKKKIPFLGVAGLAVRFIQPAGVKSFKFAMFEDQDFAPGERDRAFEHAFSRSLDSKWKPMVRSRDRTSGSRSYVYSHQKGRDIELLTVTFSRRQAIVVQAKVNTEAMAKFIDKPEMMGIALAGSASGSPFPLDPSGNYGGFGSGPSRSIDSLETVTPADTAQEQKSRPELKRRGENDPEFNPIAGTETESSPPKVERDPDALRLEARLINLNVKAFDRSGNAISTLARKDFRVLEDGVEQNIFSFEPVSAPINVVLLLDLSGSTRQSRKLMIQTAKTFIDSLGSGDRIAIAAFTRKFHLLSDFTGEKAMLKNAVEKVEDIEGDTAFYDAMWETFDLLDRLKDARKAIVVLTDGMDNSLTDSDYQPAEHPFDELLERAQEQDATIYPIYLNPDEARLLNQQGQLKEDLPNRSDQRYRVRERERIERRLRPHLTAHRQVNQLAEETAGTVFVAHGQNELDGVYQRIAAELRLTYTIAYAPKKTALDGAFRKITVEVKREGAVARTRRGYLAK